MIIDPRDVREAVQLKAWFQRCSPQQREAAQADGLSRALAGISPTDKVVWAAEIRSADQLPPNEDVQYVVVRANVSINLDEKRAPPYYEACGAARNGRACGQ